MECFRCGVDMQKSLLFGMNVGFCPKCRLVFTDHQQSEIESLRSQLELERKITDAAVRPDIHNAMVGKLRSELAALKTENSQLRSGLEKLEWCVVGYNEYANPEISHTCPVCGSAPEYEDGQHALDCWLSALLKGDSNAN